MLKRIISSCWEAFKNGKIYYEFAKFPTFLKFLIDLSSAHRLAHFRIVLREWQVIYLNAVIVNILEAISCTLDFNCGRLRTLIDRERSGWNPHRNSCEPEVILVPWNLGGHSSAQLLINFWRRSPGNMVQNFLHGQCSSKIIWSDPSSSLAELSCIVQLLTIFLRVPTKIFNSQCCVPIEVYVMTNSVVESGFRRLHRPRTRTR